MPATTQVIASRSNARVKQLRAAFGGHARISGGLVGIEGHHLLEEALRSGMALKTIFLAEGEELPGYAPRSIEVVRVSEEVFRSVTETRSPQGIAALMVPRAADAEELLRGIPLIVVAAGLQDPGNLGTLIRSAEAFGASGVATMPGTVSAWNGKALRASVGSIFRIPVAALDANGLRNMQRRGVRMIAAVGTGAAAVDVSEAAEMDLTGSVAMLIGSEGAGLAPEYLDLADAKVTIPCTGPVESLNAGVAGSILLYEAQRQRALVGVRP